MSPFRNRNLIYLMLAHFVVDFSSGAIPLIVAGQTAPLALTQGQVGLIAFTYSLTSGLGQPLFGLFADSVRAPLLALGGILWQAVLIGLTGLADRFEVLLGLVMAAGLGAAAFHPPGAGGVPRITPPDQRGSAMSIFMLGGTSGYAFGPLVAGAILNWLGPRSTLLLLLPVMISAPVVFRGLLRLRFDSGASPRLAARQSGATSHTLARSVALGVGLLALLIMFRQWAGLSVNTYLPQHFLQQGQNVQYAGNIAFSMALGAAFGSLSAGFLADRLGRDRVIMVSLLLGALALYALIHVGGIGLPVLAFALGFFIDASLPLTLVLGQELMPRRPGVMTGLTLGFTFAVGGLGAAVTGAIAEQIGLPTVFEWLPMLLVLSALAALGLIAARRTRAEAVAGD